LIARLQIPYPGPVFFVSIWLTIALSVALTALSSPETKPAIAESREMIYALSILAFVGSYACRIFRPASKRAVHDPSVPPGTRR
jgi:hypothetical protein